MRLRGYFFLISDKEIYIHFEENLNQIQTTTFVVLHLFTQSSLIYNLFGLFDWALYTFSIYPHS